MVQICVTSFMNAPMPYVPCKREHGEEGCIQVARILVTLYSLVTATQQDHFVTGNRRHGTRYNWTVLQQEDKTRVVSLVVALLLFHSESFGLFFGLKFSSLGA